MSDDADADYRHFFHPKPSTEAESSTNDAASRKNANEYNESSSSVAKQNTQPNIPAKRSSKTLKPADRNRINIDVSNVATHAIDDAEALQALGLEAGIIMGAMDQRDLENNVVQQVFKAQSLLNTSLSCLWVLPVAFSLWLVIRSSSVLNQTICFKFLGRGCYQGKR